MNTLLPVLLLAILLTSFQPTPYSRILQDVNTYIQSDPDSALRVLSEIPESRLTRKSDRAEYALLMSIALDKNYIDVDQDTLILKAVEYFERKGSRRNRFLARYYQGRVYENSGDRVRAIETFSLAERDTMFADDPSKVRLYAAR